MAHILGEGAQYPLLKGASSSGASASVKPVTKDRTFQIVQSGTSTTDIEVSNDDTNWVSIASTSSANDGFESKNAPWKFVRANVTSYTSGTIDVFMGT